MMTATYTYIVTISYTGRRLCMTTMVDNHMHSMMITTSHTYVFSIMTTVYVVNNLTHSMMHDNYVQLTTSYTP